MQGHLDTVKCLVDLGADIHAVAVDGSMAINVASACGHKKIAYFLLKRGADATKKDKLHATRVCACVCVFVCALVYMCAYTCLCMWCGSRFRRQDLG
jgi:ankyrin repeat protein